MDQISSPSGVDSFPFGRLSIGARLTLLVTLLALEGLLIFVHIRQPEFSAIGRWFIAFGFIFIALAYPRMSRSLKQVADRVECENPAWRFLAGHAATVVLFWILASPPLRQGVPIAIADLVTVCWCATGLIGIAFAALIFAPPEIWLTLLRSTGKMWIYAVVGAFAASESADWLAKLWDQYLLRSLTGLTFDAVKLLLRPFFADLVADPATRLLGSRKFSGIVAGSCSGWEGISLAFFFTVVWLWVSRRDVRFPHALILIPATMTLMFGLNIVRLAALILIGDAISPRIAISGFHSQAGWIAFNAVALGIVWIVPQVGWLSVGKSRPVESGVLARNPTIPYLLPFVSILAAGMISRATSAGFEWLYPLRFVAAAVVLWICRQHYRALIWKPSLAGPLAGCVVFLIWIALDRGPHPDNGIASGLASLSPAAKAGWLFIRTIAAVVTVPIAEELAFRGFLLRRLISSDFESVKFRRFTWPALLASSLLFGLMHGDRWIAGSLAGMIYALVMLRRGSIGDALVAHATTNAILAASVLIGGNWYLW